MSRPDRRPDTLRVWDLRSGASWTLNVFNDNNVQSLAFTEDGTRLLVGCWDSTIRIWNFLHNHELPLLGRHSLAVGALTTVARRSIAISGSWDRQVRVWNLDYRTDSEEVERHQERQLVGVSWRFV